MIPSANPLPMIARLNTELVRALGTTELQEKFKLQIMYTVPGTPEQCAVLFELEPQDTRASCAMPEWLGVSFAR